MQTTLLNRPTIMDAMITMSRQMQVCVGPKTIVDKVVKQTGKKASIKPKKEVPKKTKKDHDLVEAHQTLGNKRHTELEEDCDLTNACHLPKPKPSPSPPPCPAC